MQQQQCVVRGEKLTNEYNEQFCLVGLDIAAPNGCEMRRTILRVQCMPNLLQKAVQDTILQVYVYRRRGVTCHDTLFLECQLSATASHDCRQCLYVFDERMKGFKHCFFFGPPVYRFFFFHPGNRCFPYEGICRRAMGLYQGGSARLCGAAREDIHQLEDEVDSDGCQALLTYYVSQVTAVQEEKKTLESTNFLLIAWCPCVLWYPMQVISGFAGWPPSARGRCGK